MTSYHRGDDERAWVMPEYRNGHRVPRAPSVWEQIEASDKKNGRYLERERLNELLSEATAGLERMDEEDGK